MGLETTAFFERVGLVVDYNRQDWPDQIAAVPLGFRAGGRCGTVHATLEEFASKVGEPHDQAPREHWRNYDNHDLIDGAGKVSASWRIQTPRGLAEISDYWWNREDELSIRAVDHRAVIWVVQWCHLYGFDADRQGKIVSRRNQLASA